MSRFAAYFKYLALAATSYTYTTPRVLEALNEAGKEVAEFLNRHQRGDWGDLGEEDKREMSFQSISDCGFSLLITRARA